MRTCVFDIEGNSLNHVIVDKKGSARPECNKVWCVATKELNGEAKLWTDMDAVVRYLNTFDVLVGHNALSYDFPVMRKLYNLQKPKLIVDTVVVSRLMYPDRESHPFGSNSLEDWGRHLGFPKIDYKGGWDNYSEEMGKYCVNDVILGERIYLTQLDFIKKNKELVRFEHNVSWVLMEQTENGFGYALADGESLLKELMLEKLGIEDEMRQIFPNKIHERYSEKTGKRLKDKTEVFNPGSRQQIAERLNDKYGWIPPETEKGNPKVDESVLSVLEYPEAKALVKYFDIIKLIGMVEDWNLRAGHSGDGRIHGSVNAQGAATGRCTHAQPNVAQVSGDHRARALWVPGYEGWVQVGADLKGLELRMLAHYMARYDGGKYADVLLNGDIHTHNMEAAGLSSRNLAKSFIYAYLYGAGNAKLSKVLSCTVRDAENLRKRFQKEIPALAKVQQEVQFQAAKHNSVQLPDGRRVPVRSEHAALNTLLQGAGAIVSKQWMLHAFTATHKRAKQMAYIHDELQYAAPKDDAESVGQAIKDAAVQAGKTLNMNIPIEADYTIGASWADTH